MSLSETVRVTSTSRPVRWTPTTCIRFTLSDSVAERSIAAGIYGGGERTNLTVSSTVLSNNILGLLTTEAAIAVGITQSTVVGNATSLFVASGTLETLGDDVVRGNTTNTTGIIMPVGKNYRIVGASGRVRARPPE
jgi:hypothetical protein